LYSPEELEPILSTLHDELRNQYEVKTTFELFVRRVQKNLSIVVSLDNSHPQFLQHCASNPALYNKCSIIWHEGWSREAMRQVAQKEMKDELAQVQNKAEELIQTALQLHDSSEQFGSSPLRFVNLVMNFKAIFTKMFAKSGGQTKHLKAGLKKLKDAATMVDDLQKKAGEARSCLPKNKRKPKWPSLKLLRAWRKRRAQTRS